MQHIQINGWDKWQTYRKDRGTPPWIKVYRNLMSNEEWVSLSDAEKGQLVSLWILAADKSGQIPSSPVVLQRMCMLESQPNINKFKDLGFLSTNCQPTGDHVVTMNDILDAPETETETETEYTKKVSCLEKLSVKNIDSWLKKKRSENIYVDHDEHRVLEVFKNYCQANGKSYKDYAAAYKSAFDWEKCKPTKKKNRVSGNNDMEKYLNEYV